MNHNVVFFVTHLNSGGIENYLLRFLQEKHQAFDNIYVYCKSGLDGQLDDLYLRIPNVQLIKKRIGYLDLKAHMYLRSFLRENNIQAVCDFTGNFAGRILYSSKKSGINIRVVFYRSSSLLFKETFVRLKVNAYFHYLVKRYATNILANSDYAFKAFFGSEFVDPRTKVIRNGINARLFLKESQDLRKELGIPEKAFIVGHTGRYNPTKNHATIIEVADRLIQEHSDFYFILCGNGVEENLQTSLIYRKIDKRVLVFENRNDIPDFLNTMDCYFFPSLTEGQPNSLIEAMIAGLPIVTSNIEPIKESTPRELHSFLKDPLDVEGYVNLINKVYKSSEFAQKLTHRNWAIKNFDYNQKFEEFYKVLTNVNSPLYT